MKTILLLPSVVIIPLILGGCETRNAHTVFNGDGRSLVMANAEHMPIVQTRVRRNGQGPVQPEYITCIAPSPDIATAVSKSFQLAAEASAKIPQGTKASAAFAMSRAQTQSIAQLGERIATIQLLRDGLYRACEAFANGAISETAYAVMLSRYDDTMVTLMSIDLAAGAFGRSLAGIGGEAEGEAKATGDYTTRVKERLEAERKLEKVLDRKNQHDRAIKETQADRETMEASLDQAIAGGADSNKVETLQASVDRSENKLQELNRQTTDFEKSIRDAEREMTEKKLAEVKSKSSGSVTVAGGITPGQQNAEIAKTIARIQRKYIENINSDAVSTACIVAMSYEKNQLGKHCEKIIAQIFAEDKIKLQGLKAEAEARVSHVQKVTDYHTVIEELVSLLKSAKTLSAEVVPAKTVK